MGGCERSRFQYSEGDEPKENVCRDRYRARGHWYYRGDQSSANFDDTSHAKCIDLHDVRGDDEKATALRVRQDTRDLDP